MNKGDMFDAQIYHPRDLQAELLHREQKIWASLGCEVDISVLHYELTTDDMGNESAKILLPCIIIEKSGFVYVKVKYKRRLGCSNIPRIEPAPGTPEFAIWSYFGKLLSETDGDGKNPVVVSDIATIESIHEAMFAYWVELNFPDEELKIEGEECISEGQDIHLSVPSAYKPYDLRWTVNGEETAYTGTDVTIKSDPDKYLNTIVCTARACKGQTRSASFEVGKPVSKPEMSDFGCLAADKTVLDLSVKAPEPQLTYHWMYENVDGKVVWEKKGSSVRLEGIPQNETGRIKLMATGGCKNSDTAQQTLYRTFRTGTRHITLHGGRNCAFIGDTLSFSMEDPLPSFVWRVNDTMPGNKPLQVFAPNTDPIFISVFVPGCPDRKITDTFNIRDTFKVSLASNPTCISVKDEHVIKLTSNGLNPEVHWYGNGVVIDSTKYSKKDSILLRLTNPGDPHLYVAVTAMECGRKSDTLLVLRPLPEKPSLDTLWNALTPCIPLGIADTIELRVQPQEGVNFVWNFVDNPKFQRIAESDSHSIRVATNYALFDEDRDVPITVSVHARVVGCGDSVITEPLYATGAGLGEEWVIGSWRPSDRVKLYTVGFYKDSVEEIENNRIEFDTFSFAWTSSVGFVGKDNTQQVIRIMKSPPFSVNCFLTNKNTSCYSYYSQTIEEVSTLQNIATSSSTGIAQNGTGNENVQGMSYAIPPQEENHRGGFLLAPNPTHGNTLLYMERAMVDKRAVIEILTEQGVCLYRQKVDADVAELPTASFRSGLYFVRVRVGDEDIIVRKLIVQ